MKKEEKQAKFISLRFFANRFGVEEKDCAWGVRETKIGDEVYYSPIVKIKNSPIMAIDIMRDRIVKNVGLFSRQAKMLDATMTEQADMYSFTAVKEEGCGNEIVVFLSKKGLKEAYRGKSLLPELL